ncbi:hypothetical protein CRG98_031013 [Punica granatum]|uniref:Uncharacterized protein n=1 Tax=Punica granatum TaxID=22663 RepID=A0A2I0IX76_PUNGR|nr:hypothetical protein CRG98_031013 [Punica granatum]
MEPRRPPRTRVRWRRSRPTREGGSRPLSPGSGNGSNCDNETIIDLSRAMGPPGQTPLEVWPRASWPISGHVAVSPPR